MERNVSKEKIEKRKTQWIPKHIDYREFEEETPLGKVVIEYFSYDRESMVPEDKEFDKGFNLSLIRTDGVEVPISSIYHNAVKDTYHILGPLPNEGDAAETFITLTDDRIVTEVKPFSEYRKDCFLREKEETPHKYSTFEKCIIGASVVLAAAIVTFAVWTKYF